MEVSKKHQLVELETVGGGGSRMDMFEIGRDKWTNDTVDGTN